MERYGSTPLCAALALSIDSSFRKYSPRRYTLASVFTDTVVPGCAIPRTSAASGTVRFVYWFERRGGVRRRAEVRARLVPSRLRRKGVTHKGACQEAFSQRNSRAQTHSLQPSMSTISSKRFPILVLICDPVSGNDFNRLSESPMKGWFE